MDHHVVHHLSLLIMSKEVVSLDGVVVIVFVNIQVPSCHQIEVV